MIFSQTIKKHILPINITILYNVIVTDWFMLVFTSNYWMNFPLFIKCRLENPFTYVYW